MNYKIGDVIRYATWTRAVRRVRVETKESDIKNGRPGFSGKELDRDGRPIMGVWGYDSQIVGRFPAKQPCKVK